MRKSKYTYVCPRCGNKAGTDIKSAILTCENYEGHHSKKVYDMVLVVDTDKSEETD